MQKPKRTPKVTITFTAIIILLFTIFIIVWIHRPKECRDIIGDGYAMGTDPKPVVIGNSCDH